MIELIKSTISPSAYAWLRSVSYAPKRLALSVAKRWPPLLSLFYVIDPAFRREQVAVASGFLAHHGRSAEDSVFYQLRRNIHRIEKGLLMRPRRSTFGLDYVRETVEFYSTAVAKEPIGKARAELCWAHDVLANYFEVVQDHSVVCEARNQFRAIGQITTESTSDQIKKIPFRREANPAVSVSDLYSLARQRRSVRWFLDQPVERGKVDQALEVAIQSPSACNRQPFVFRIFDDPMLVRDVAKLPMGTVGFAHNIPMIAVIVGDLSAYFGERDRHGIYVDASLASMAFMLALETLGLSSCPLNWPDISKREQKMERLLGLKPHERVVMCIALGYADREGLIAYSQKRELNQVRSYNELR